MPAAVQSAEELVVVVGAVHGDDGPGVEAEQARAHPVVSPGLRQQDIGGHVVVVVQQHVHLDPTLGASKAGPRKQRQAQGNGRRVQAHQLVLEAELRLAPTEALPTPQAIGQVPEQILEQVRRPMGVGVGQRRALGRPADPEVHQLAYATGQAMADLT